MSTPLPAQSTLSYLSPFSLSEVLPFVHAMDITPRGLPPMSSGPAGATEAPASPADPCAQPGPSVSQAGFPHGYIWPSSHEHPWTPHSVCGAAPFLPL